MAQDQDKSLRFDDNGEVITDQNYDGEARTFEELTDAEIENYVANRKAEVAKLDAIYERKSKKVQALNETLKDDDEGEEPKGDKPEESKGDDVSKTILERQDRIELRQEGYADSVIDEIMKLGGKSALGNPILKKSADELQSAYDAERATEGMDGGSNSSPETKYSKEDLENMSVEELEKVLPHADK